MKAVSRDLSLQMQVKQGESSNDLFSVNSVRFTRIIKLQRDRYLEILKKIDLAQLYKVLESI